MVPQGPKLCPWWLGGLMRRMFPLRVWRRHFPLRMFPPRGYQVKVPYNITRRRRDMLVLIFVLSLDPKPKVVRPKTKTYFTKKVLVRCHWHLIPTLAPRGAFWKGKGRSAPTQTLPKAHPLLRLFHLPKHLPGTLRPGRLGGIT